MSGAPRRSERPASVCTVTSVESAEPASKLAEPAAKRPRKDQASDGLSGFRLGRVLGEGGFGTVRQGVDPTGRAVAVKMLDRKGVAARTFQREADVLKGVGAHQSVCSLLDHFSTPLQWVLVLELAAGGEVFDRIVSRGPLSEASAALVVRQVSLALEHLRSRRVVHRDIKPENLLYVSQHEDAGIKVADFGLALRVASGSTVREEVGTLPYMAIEIIKGSPYSHPIDVWSLGVCLFALLGGYLPFDPAGSASPSAQRQRIAAGLPAFESSQGGYPQQWSRSSPAARQLIARMLQTDPRARITPAQILALPWVSGGEAPVEALPGSDEHLKRFNAARRVWRTAADAVALAIGAPHTAAAISGARTALPGEAAARPDPLPRAALEEMRAAFCAFDADGDGFIDQAELSAAMRSLGACEADAEQMLHALDVDADGRIDFDEFCACASPLYKSSTTALRRAFDFFDLDGNGKIDTAELRTILTRLGLSAPRGAQTKANLDGIIEAIFASADANSDGRICFDEFIKVFGATHCHPS